jgi:hypothetical protein
LLLLCSARIQVLDLSVS